MNVHPAQPAAAQPAGPVQTSAAQTFPPASDPSEEPSSEVTGPGVVSVPLTPEVHAVLEELLQGPPITREEISLLLIARFPELLEASGVIEEI